LSARPRIGLARLHPSRAVWQRILVPVDFSVESKRALRCAAELAAPLAASLTLVHVVEPVIYPLECSNPLASDGYDRKRAAEARTRLNALCRRTLGTSRAVETVIRTGLAFFEITEAAKALGADLIVIGTHGYTGLKHALLGSTAEKVVRHAPCPVLVVRDPQMKSFYEC
jgi:nucleotide-binding universal stress UspA family protein